MLHSNDDHGLRGCRTGTGRGGGSSRSSASSAVTDCTACPSLPMPSRVLPATPRHADLSVPAALIRVPPCATMCHHVPPDLNPAFAFSFFARRGVAWRGVACGQQQGPNYTAGMSSGSRTPPRRRVARVGGSSSRRRAVSVSGEPDGPARPRPASHALFHPLPSSPSPPFLRAHRSRQCN